MPSGDHRVNDQNQAGGRRAIDRLDADDVGCAAIAHVGLADDGPFDGGFLALRVSARNQSGHGTPGLGLANGNVSHSGEKDQ